MKNITLIFFFIFSTLAFSQDPYKEAFDRYSVVKTFEVHLENAKKFKKLSIRGTDEMAFLEILKALSIKPKSSEALSIKGQLLYLMSRDHYVIFSQLSDAISLGSKDGCTYLYRAKSRLNLDEEDPERSTSKICTDIIVAKTLGISGCVERERELLNWFDRCN